MTSETSGQDAESVFIDWCAIDDASRPSPDDLLSAHPEIADELRELIAAQADFDGALAAFGLGTIAPTREQAARYEAAIRERLDELGDRNPAAWPYDEETSVGEGGFGHVTSTVELGLERRLALKRPLVDDPSDPTPVERQRIARLLEEGRLLAQLDHPAIVPMHTMAVDERGLPYLAMRFVEGVDLAEAIRRGHAGDAKWSRPRLVDVLRRVCEAVAFAHERRVVHRDLKPDNVRVGARGEVYVMDWGLGLDLKRVAPASLGPAVSDDEGASSDERLTRAGTVMGTPRYMAPEQQAGDLSRLDPRTDVFALGAILRDVLVGTGADLDDVARADVPPALAAICAKATADAPDDRYPSAVELGDELQAFLDNRVVEAYATGPWAELRAWVGRNRLAAGVAAAAFALAVVFVAVLYDVNRELDASNDELNATVAELNETVAQRNTAIAEKDVVIAERDDAITELEASQAALRAEQEALRRRTAEVVLGQADRARILGSPQQVLDVLDEFPDPTRDPGLLALLRGRALMELGRDDDAYAALEQAADDPSALDHRGDILVTMARIAKIRGDDADFESLLDDAMQENYSEHSRHLLAGWLAPSADKVRDALQRTVDEDPTDTISRSQLAVLHLFLGDVDAATIEISLARNFQADALFPQAAGVLAQLFTGEYEEARVEALDPAGPIAQRERSDVFIKLIDQWEAVELTGNDYLAAGAIGSLLEQTTEQVGGRVMHPIFDRYLASFSRAMGLLAIGAPTESFGPGLPYLEEAHATIPEPLSGWLLAQARYATAPEGQATARAIQAQRLLSNLAPKPALVPGMERSIRMTLVAFQDALAVRVYRGWLEGPEAGELRTNYEVNADRLLEDDVALEFQGARLLTWTGIHLRDFARAVATLAMIPEEDRDRPRAFEVEHRVRIGQGNVTAALAVAQRWLEAHPDDPKARQVFERDLARLRETVKSAELP